MSNLNIAVRLEHWAKKIPNNAAVIVPSKNKVLKVNFQGLHQVLNRLASGLVKFGIQRRQNVLLMVRPGMDLITITFALFKIGAVPVLIDPGLDRSNFLKCVEEIKPEAMIGIPLAHVARIVFRKPFINTQRFVTVGQRWFWGGKTLDEIKKLGNNQFDSTSTSPDDPAAILFTSGSTGTPKGVLYTHGMFSSQTDVLEHVYGFKPGEADLPTFPLFALFSTALGMTAVIPEMDPTRPAQVNPRNIIEPIQKYKISSSFGSPALWDTVSRYCLKHDIQLPPLKRVLMAGAPVQGELLKRFDRILDHSGKVFTPYGATEALPVTSIERHQILKETQHQTEKGQGVCVGHQVPGMEIKIIRITDRPLLNWKEVEELSIGETGEIIVRGQWVTSQYFNREDATRQAKIRDGESFWHRMGDVGYFDESGRLWFCGRKSHRVICNDRTLFTIPCEGIFNRHPEVKRSALVGVGPPQNRTPVLIIEAEPGKHPTTKEKLKPFKDALLKLGNEFALTQNIELILFHSSFPIDIRHNAKIFREKLERWAAKQLHPKN